MSTQQIKGRVYGGPMKICGGAGREVLPLCRNQAQKDGLQHIFSIHGTSGYSIRRPKHELIVLAKESLDPGLFLRIGGRRNLSQVSTGCLHLFLLHLISISENVANGKRLT